MKCLQYGYKYEKLIWLTEFNLYYTFNLLQTKTPYKSSSQAVFPFTRYCCSLYFVHHCTTPALQWHFLEHWRSH